MELPEGSWWDWDFSWSPGELRLVAGYDLSYHHDLELVFADPLPVRCPAHFQDPVFRAPTPEERRLVERQCGEPPGVLVAFEADSGGAEPVTALIAAGSLEVRVGLLLRYGRGVAPRTVRPVRSPSTARPAGNPVAAPSPRRGDAGMRTVEEPIAEAPGERCGAHPPGAGRGVRRAAGVRRRTRRTGGRCSTSTGSQRQFDHHGPVVRDR
ncbi:hypothetical protein [Kitasatospora sp. NPDC086791]|uniref:hypothetical protein n=1 Tax=Kitasatospora sp. NPDC086791 TaxID=3155178 RepID=UPI0034345117